jgi:hypothetical protein
MLQKVLEMHLITDALAHVSSGGVMLRRLMVQQGRLQLVEQHEAQLWNVH